MRRLYRSKVVNNLSSLGAKRYGGIAKALMNREGHETEKGEDCMQNSLQWLRVWLQEVHFLGHVVNQSGIHVNQGYYHRFIINFSMIAKPLTLLTQKNQKVCKANVVADALSRKEWVKPKHVRPMAYDYSIRITVINFQHRVMAFNQENILAERLHSLDQQMERKGDGSLYLMDRIWVSLVGGMRTVIMDEALRPVSTISLERDKMYFDSR
ncbi:hypothetical protein Tco_0857074 [Tanacetum coccineum]|uniref:Uncharacterized protein n=1 Tax=Tanacetum coccineum TaxID=301880 RepID=A0ABQ5B8L3_9ASTR